MLQQTVSQGCSRGLLSNADHEAPQEGLNLPQDKNKVLQLRTECKTPLIPTRGLQRRRHHTSHT